MHFYKNNNSETFTFMHLADAFIQSNLYSEFRLYVFCQYDQQSNKSEHLE